MSLECAGYVNCIISQSTHSSALCRQIQDVATSSRMTTLGSRSKRLQASILQPLENLQNEILYHLTALELQRDPWAKQVNQTLNHLKSIQSYLENKAGEICHNMTRDYRDR